MKCELVLVEDSEADVRVVFRAVERENLKVDVVHLNSAERAEAYFATKRTYGVQRVVLLDINLPGMDGIAFLEKLKSKEETMSIPVIVWSTSDLPADIARAYTAQANSYIVKPMALADITDAIAGICRYWFGVATVS